MEYVIVILFFYALVFIPVVFSCRVLGYGVLAGLLYLLRKKEELFLGVLFMVLLFSLFSSSLAVTEVNIPVSMENVTGLYGKVVTEPNRKKGRYTGFNILLESVMDVEGNYFSSSGKVYVIGPDLSLTLNDTVYVEGEFMDTYFLASGGDKVKESPWGKVRRKFNAAFIRSLPSGDVGNTIALLLTGTTLDGDSTIQENVRSLGLSHLVSLSGMHLGFITSIVLPLLSLFLSKRKAKRVKDIFLFIFVYLAGMRPSLIRSLIFVILIPLFGIEHSFILSLIFLIKLFPYYADEVATILSFTSLSGILLFAGVSDYFKKKGIGILTAIMTSVAATVSSAPVVFSLFGSWQPYSFLFSIVGMPLITILFMMTVVRFIIPKSDFIIKIILDIIHSSGTFGKYMPLSESFTLYYPLCGIFLLVSGLVYLIRRRR